MAKKLEKTELIELNEAYNKVMIWFFSFPEKAIGLNELSGLINISKTTAKRVVKKLVSEGFLSIEVLGKLWRISVNSSHRYNYSRKISYNLTMIHESGILKSIHEILSNSRSVVLFGSYRKGDDNEKSDIDIAVEVLGEDSRIIEIRVIPKLGFRKNVPVNLHVFSRETVDINLFSNIANGIVLEGFLEVKP